MTAKLGAHERTLALVPDLGYPDGGGRCPKDQGLLVPVWDEALISARCVNCGWRQYSTLGKLMALISQARAESDAEKEEFRCERRWPRRKGGADGVGTSGVNGGGTGDVSV
jgi:hypothetical protein